MAVKNEPGIGPPPDPGLLENKLTVVMPEPKAPPSVRLTITSTKFNELEPVENDSAIGPAPKIRSLPPGRPPKLLKRTVFCARAEVKINDKINSRPNDFLRFCIYESFLKLLFTFY